MCDVRWGASACLLALLIAPGCGGGRDGGTGAMGGTTGLGGATASGGTTGTGGATATGGHGGTMSSGGATGSGGTTATGGVAGTIGAGGTAGGAGKGGDTGRGGSGSGGSGGSAKGGAGGGGGNGGTGAGGSDGLAGQAGGGRGGTGGSPGIAKIMAIGDSITRATCWRDFLWQQLEQNFAGRFDMVGTLNYDYGCSVGGFDADNQGYSSSLITEVVAGVTNARTCDPYCPSLSDIKTALNTTKPTVVLMHWGTNDVWNAKSTSSITSAYSAVIDAARAANPSVTILVAQLIPMNVTGATCSGCSCASCSTAIPALNSAITTFAASKTTAASPVIVVDQYTGFSATSDTRDGVHPNTSGSQKMATRWYDALTTNQLVR